MANQHTSELVGIERPWADAVVAGREADVAELLRPHTSKQRARAVLDWLRHGAPYEWASANTVMHWRRVLAAAGEPPRPLHTRAPGNADKRSLLDAAPVAA